MEEFLNEGEFHRERPRRSILRTNIEGLVHVYSLKYRDSFKRGD